MSFVQDFVREYLKMYGVLGCFIGGLVFGIVILSLYILNSIDEELGIKLSGKLTILILVTSVHGTVYMLFLQQGEWQGFLRGSVMLAYLLLCSVTDYYTKQVYDFIQLGVCILLAAGVLFRSVERSLGIELVVFAILQQVVFRRMYGEADVMCFTICALSLVERGIFLWTCHMGLSFLLLGIIQGFKHNLSKNGNLKVPVAFLPYIAVAYVLVL